jgi:hypothetical protein
MSRRQPSIPEPSRLPVAYLCSSEAELEALLDGSREFSKGNEFLLLIRDDKRLLDRVLPSYINAVIRERESGMRAKKLQMEMLLFLSGTMNISNAIKASGAKSSSSFIALASSEALFKEFARRYKIRKAKRYPLKLNLDVSGDVATTELESEG